MRPLNKILLYSLFNYFSSFFSCPCALSNTVCFASPPHRPCARRPGALRAGPRRRLVRSASQHAAAPVRPRGRRARRHGCCAHAPGGCLLYRLLRRSCAAAAAPPVRRAAHGRRPVQVCGYFIRITWLQKESVTECVRMCDSTLGPVLMAGAY